ncbi:MAG: hypothetical protein O2890_06595 [Cyanobacteria bacterium]|nr:hypothetical protein [Cyanobacteriota bacterium]MDA0866074.1 hypothetical protein [Cyanobacteriota bacterium]
MAQPDRKLPRDNPFWTYRDPITGRWLTVMTASQWQQMPKTCPFEPKLRQANAAPIPCPTPPQAEELATTPPLKL